MTEAFWAAWEGARDPLELDPAGWVAAAGVAGGGEGLGRGAEGFVGGDHGTLNGTGRLRGRSRRLAKVQQNPMGVPGRLARWSPSWMEVFRRSAVGIVVLTQPFRARRPGSAIWRGGCWGEGGCRAKLSPTYSGSAGVHTSVHPTIPGVTTVSRRALLCLRGGFLSRRRSGSRSSPGPGSSVAARPATSLGGWSVGCSRRR